MDASEQAPREPNTRLRAALADRHVSMDELAAVAGCSVKTVQRWAYDSRVTPHPAYAEKAARHLGIDPGWLWPRRRVPVNPDLVNLYPHIGAVPPAVWTLTASEARHTIDIATDIATGLPHGLADIIHTRLTRGTAVRLCLGSDAVPAVRLTGARTRATTGPMIGIYRFDSQMLVRLNRTGSSLDYLAPVLHLRRREQRGAFDFYLGLFEQWWRDGKDIADHDTDGLGTA